MNIPPVRMTTLEDEADRMSQPGSAFDMPAGVQFSDDQQALEYRMLIAGYADRLSDAVKRHEPLNVIRDVIARLNEIASTAIAREIRKAIAANSGKGH